MTVIDRGAPLSRIEEAAMVADVRLEQFHEVTDAANVGVTAVNQAAQANVAMDGRQAMVDAAQAEERTFNRETFVGIGVDQVAVADGGITATEGRAGTPVLAAEAGIDDLLRVRAEALRRA